MGPPLGGALRTDASPWPLSPVHPPYLLTLPTLVHTHHATQVLDLGDQAVKDAREQCAGAQLHGSYFGGCLGNAVRQGGKGRAR